MYDWSHQEKLDALTARDCTLCEIGPLVVPLIMGGIGAAQAASGFVKTKADKRRKEELEELDREGRQDEWARGEGQQLALAARNRARSAENLMSRRLASTGNVTGADLAMARDVTRRGLAEERQAGEAEISARRE